MNNPFQEEINKCILVLSEGGIILYPTDTVWGIGCDATNPDAINKIFNLKKRPDEKALIVLAENPEMIKQYVKEPDDLIFEYLKQTTKPTTVIYSNPTHFPVQLTGNNKSIAIRIPKDLFCNELLHQYKKPIVSTSANISGNPTPQIYKHIDHQVKSSVDYIVKHRQSDETISNPSSIIKISNDGKIITIRK